MHYNRKQRREMEKNLKLLDIRNKSKKERDEIAQRRKAFGEASHRRYVQDMQNRMREEDALREEKLYQNMVDTLGKEHADKVIENLKKREEQKLRNKEKK